MTNAYPNAEQIRAEFDARWKAAIERTDDLDAVHPESVAAPVTMEILLSRLRQVAKACAAEGLITPEEAERVAASADDIGQILGGIDTAKLTSVARQLR